LNSAAQLTCLVCSADLRRRDQKALLPQGSFARDGCPRLAWGSAAPTVSATIVASARLTALQLWHWGCSLATGGPKRSSQTNAQEGSMDENEHPKGALLFMLVYLFLLAALWINAYLKLWRG